MSPTGTFYLGIGKARARAHEILSAYGLTRAGTIDLRNLAFDRGLRVHDAPMEGAEGRLVRLGNRAIATVSNTIESEGKRSFVIAHEFGHFELHRDSPLFVCDAADFADWHRTRPEETEANQFAAELLMPAAWFREELRRKLFSVSAVAAMAERCKTSLTATAFRCVELDVFPSALVFCRDNEIKWGIASDNMPYRYLRRSGQPHEYSGAGEYFRSGHTSAEPTATPCHAWFGDYGLAPDEEIMEECLVMRHLNATLSLLSEV
jgi:Zn-dependent peptidase ImmA (M78 family)